MVFKSERESWKGEPEEWQHEDLPGFAESGQGMWMTSTSRERQGNEFSPRASKRNTDQMMP